jgi:hypothetical protein
MAGNPICWINALAAGAGLVCPCPIGAQSAMKAATAAVAARGSDINLIQPC